MSKVPFTKLPWKYIAVSAVLSGAGILLLSTEEVRKALGGVLLGAGLFTIMYDYLVLEKKIGGNIRIVRTASTLQLEEIYVDRSEAMKDIVTELATATGSVKVAAVAGSDFFGEGPAANAVSNLVEGRQNVHLRFLLLNPTSTGAYLRAWLEEKYGVSAESQETLDEGYLKPSYNPNEFRLSTMSARASTSQAALSNMFRMLRSPTKLSARYYKYGPSMFLVAVNRRIFIEWYHCGVEPNYKPDPISPCLGKKTMVMRFSRGSPTGIAHENNFDRLWKCKTTLRFLPPSPDFDKIIAAEPSITLPRRRGQR